MLVTVQAAGQLEVCSDGLVSSQEMLHALSFAFDIDTIFPKSKLRTHVLRSFSPARSNVGDLPEQ